MKHKTLYVGYGFSLLALVVLRVCQLAFAMESATGFYKPEYENFGFVSAVAIILSVAAITYFSFTDTHFSRREKESGKTAIFYILTAVGFIAKFAFSDLGASASLISISTISALLALLSAAVCIVDAYFLFVGKTAKNHFNILFVVFWISELITVFVRNNDVSSLPERFYETVSAALCILCSLYVVKDKEEMLTKISSKIMVALSLVTSAFCIMCSLPQLLIVISGNGNLLHSFSLSSVLYLTYGIFIPVYIFGTFTQKHKN